MREKGQTEVAKTLETPVFSRGIEILTEKRKFPIQLPTDVDSDGDTTVNLSYPTNKVWKVKDLIAMTYDDDDIQKIWNAWGKPF